MKTITIDGVEYYLTPTSWPNITSNKYLGGDLNIPTGISTCGLCNEIFRSFEKHECKPKFEVWEPKIGELVYLRGNYGYQYVSFNDLSPKYFVFKTIEEAQESHEKSMFNYEVEKFIKEQNEIWEPDFEQIKHKYYLCFWSPSGEIYIERTQQKQVTSLNKYFKSEEIGEKIIEKFDNEKLVKWWI